MSGGSHEYVAGNLTGYRVSAGAIGVFNTIYNSQDDAILNKYFDLYNVATEDDRQAHYLMNLDKIGDAIAETSTAGSSQTGWLSNNTNFANFSYPWVTRGGYHNNKNNAGVFFFNSLTGRVDGSYSFRPIISISPY